MYCRIQLGRGEDCQKLFELRKFAENYLCFLSANFAKFSKAIESFEEKVTEDLIQHIECFVPRFQASVVQIIRTFLPGRTDRFVEGLRDHPDFQSVLIPLLTKSQRKRLAYFEIENIYRTNRKQFKQLIRAGRVNIAQAIAFCEKNGLSSSLFYLNLRVCRFQRAENSLLESIRKKGRVSEKSAQQLQLLVSATGNCGVLRRLVDSFGSESEATSAILDSFICSDLFQLSLLQTKGLLAHVSTGQFCKLVRAKKQTLADLGVVAGNLGSVVFNSNLIGYERRRAGLCVGDTCDFCQYRFEPNEELALVVEFRKTFHRNCFENFELGAIVEKFPHIYRISQKFVLKNTILKNSSLLPQAHEETNFFDELESQLETSDPEKQKIKYQKMFFFRRSNVYEEIENLENQYIIF